MPEPTPTAPWDREYIAGLPRLWVKAAPGVEERHLGDVWLEGERHSRMGGDRTLVLKEIPVEIAQSVANAWNSTLDDLYRLAEAKAYIEDHQ